MDRHRRFEIPEDWVARGWQFEVERTTPGQRSLIDQHFGARRFAHNWALAEVKANLDARAADPTVPGAIGKKPIYPKLQTKTANRRINGASIMSGKAGRHECGRACHAKRGGQR